MIEALSAAAGRSVSRETSALLEEYVTRLRSESDRQNLVAASTLDSIWDRHILDSAQLVRFEPFKGARWVDVGSGAGLPGLVVAALIEGDIMLAEPRRLRADFLRELIPVLGLERRARVEQSKIEQVRGKFDVVTGRAVTRLDRFLGMTIHLSHNETVWVLPKGRNAESELEHAQRNWHCAARVETSRTDPDSRILVLSRVGKRT